MASPSASCWRAKNLALLPATLVVTFSMGYMVSSATAVSSGLTTTIAASTPIMVMAELSMLGMLWHIMFSRVSISLVYRLIMSPYALLSK